MTASSLTDPPTRRGALVLAAGNGDRFDNGTRQSKLLQLLAGRPIILRTLETAHEAGVSRFEIVLGYQAEALRQVIERHRPAGTSVHFCFNPDWHLENGVSALAARERLSDGPFALLMGDHVFEPDVLARLLATRLGPDESVLAVDSKPASPEVAAEATKVQMRGSRIVAIGKDLTEYDALDTGLFVCSPALFDELAAARAHGETTLSAGIRRLARRNLMRGLDVGGAGWCDIDTVADLEAAESLLAVQPERV